MITENRDQIKLLREVAKDKSVEAVLLFINSPGGTTTGGEALFEAIRGVAAKKPVVAQFGTVATSAAYIAGLATDRIVARGNTITGSVGVIFQWADVSELLGKLGVKMNEVKSGPLKANPSPFQPADEAGRQTAQQMVAESMRWFVDLVASRRGINTADVPGLREGRVFSGREALEYKLVDQIGGEREAQAWLEEKRGVSKGLKIVDWKPKRDDDWSWIDLFTKSIARVAGASTARLLESPPTTRAWRCCGLTDWSRFGSLLKIEQLQIDCGFRRESRDQVGADTENRCRQPASLSPGHRAHRQRHLR